MTYVYLLPRNPYVKLPEIRTSNCGPRTSNCGPRTSNCASPVRQTARPRTSNCGVPYAKLPGLLIGTGGAVAPLGSGLLADIVSRPPSRPPSRVGGCPPARVRFGGSGRSLRVGLVVGFGRRPRPGGSGPAPTAGPWGSPVLPPAGPVSGPVAVVEGVAGQGGADVPEDDGDGPEQPIEPGGRGRHGAAGVRATAGPGRNPGRLVGTATDRPFNETLAPPPGVSCPGIAKGPHRLRPAGTSDGPGPVPEGLQDKAWRVTRGPATFHPVSEAPPRSSILKSPVVELKSPFNADFRGAK